jgi:choice-of-anchor A domain-containing protein
MLCELSGAYSDIEGKVAVAGKVNLMHYSIGAKIVDAGCNPKLITGANVSWANGNLNQGKLVVGQDGSSLTAVGGICNTERAYPIDFAAASTSLKQLSLDFSTLPKTGDVVNTGGSVVIRGAMKDVEVIPVDARFFIDTAKIIVRLENTKPDAVIVFNIAGADSGIVDMNMTALVNTQVVYNFYEAKTVKISGVNVKGSVLAPLAEITAFNGLIEGQVVGCTLKGKGPASPNCPSIQVNWNPLSHKCTPRYCSCSL